MMALGIYEKTDYYTTDRFEPAGFLISVNFLTR
jgi:hypothetical protein